jgi:hypothetical protein
MERTPQCGLQSVSHNISSGTKFKLPPVFLPHSVKGIKPQTEALRWSMGTGGLSNVSGNGGIMFRLNAGCAAHLHTAPPPV